MEYKKGAGSSGGYHTWWYYFDKDTYDLVANYLDYGNGHSYTSYKTFTNIGGIRMHELRHSHAANEQKEVGRIKTIMPTKKCNLMCLLQLIYLNQLYNE